MTHATLRQLKVFEAVTRLLCFSRPAEECHLTQPAVSTQIWCVMHRLQKRLSPGAQAFKDFLLGEGATLIARMMQA